MAHNPNDTPERAAASAWRWPACAAIAATLAFVFWGDYRAENAYRLGWADAYETVPADARENATEWGGYYAIHEALRTGKKRHPATVND